MQPLFFWVQQVHDIPVLTDYLAHFGGGPDAILAQTAFKPSHIVPHLSMKTEPIPEDLSETHRMVENCSSVQISVEK